MAKAVSDPPPMTSANIDSFDWKKGHRIHRSSDGSVFFVSNESGSTVVLKGSSQIVQELFANRFFERFSSVRVPRSRIIEYTNDEWSLIKTHLPHLTHGNQGVELALKKSLDRAFFMVMELVVGRSMIDLTHDMACSIFGTSSGEQQQQQQQQATATLTSLGHMIAADIALNNWDRLPMPVWDNEGNAQNLMFTVPDGHLVAIDQAHTTINSATFGVRYERYMTRAKNFAASCARLDATDADDEPAWAALRMMLGATVGVVLDRAAINAVKRGFNEALGRLALVTLDDLTALKNEVRSTVSVDWADVWRSGVAAIDEGFILSAIRAMVAGATEAGLSLPPSS